MRHGNTALTHAHPLQNLQDTAILSYRRHLALQNKFHMGKVTSYAMFCFLILTWLFRRLMEQLLLDNSFCPKNTTFKQVTSNPLQEHMEIQYCKTILRIAAVERGASLVDSLKRNRQGAVSQASHNWLEAQCKNELQKDPPAHLFQVLPSSLTIFSTQLFCIPQLDFRGKKKSNHRKAQNIS